MQSEWKYVLWFGFWIALWQLVPLVAWVFLIMIFLKTFLGLRQERLSKGRERAGVGKDWEMESRHDVGKDYLGIEESQEARVSQVEDWLKDRERVRVSTSKRLEEWRRLEGFED